METFVEALKKLKEGDVCYAHGDHNPAHFDETIRHDLADHGQHPYAAVITCGDSRVPPEHIFSVGLGSLFVIRNAGNVIGPFELGSAEYAAEHLQVPLILVLGHTHCGAVESTLAGGAEGQHQGDHRRGETGHRRGDGPPQVRVAQCPPQREGAAGKRDPYRAGERG